MQPDRRTDPRASVSRLLSSVGRRRLWRHLASSVLAAACVFALFAVAANLVGQPGWWILRGAVAAAIGVGVMAWTRRSRSRVASAAALERVCPELRNVLITAEELERHPQRASPLFAARVYAAANEATARIRAADVVPAWTVIAPSLLAILLIALTTPSGMRSTRQRISEAVAHLPVLGSARGSVTVTIEPPAYTRRPSVTLKDPDRIDVLAGSRLQFRLPGAGSRLRFGNTPVADGWTAAESGYFVLEDEGSGQRLIPLAVTADRAPAVRIEAPAKDLLLPNGSGAIPIRIVASDDLGLELLELRFTKVSGSGEQFEFQEGTHPVRLERASPLEWRARASFSLAPLKLAAGDSLVYRAVARDARPGERGLASSDTYFVEIAGPGQVALEGVEMPPDMERYALSQQMVVQKIERLRAREATTAREAVVEEAAAIAAEQRSVRANFIFLLGGHVEDEEEEAEQSHEIQEGRLENTARRDINSAISLMTRAEQGLVGVNTGAALPPAKLAVEALQRAFGRSRYLLRSLAVRSRVDPSRRLTGDRSAARDWRRPSSTADVRAGEAARSLLARVLDLGAAATSGTPVRGADLRAAAEAALAIDPASRVWQEVAAGLTSAGEQGVEPADVARALNDALHRIVPEARKGLVARSSAGSETAVSRAWRAAERQ